MSEVEVVVLAGARTPQGRLLGQLTGFSAVDLGAHAIRHALERACVDAAEVDQVLMGQVIQAGSGQNPAKQAAVAAGLPMSVPAATTNKVCLSGLDTVVQAARLLRLGAARVVVAGGQESMTSAPHLTRVRAGVKYGPAQFEDSLAVDGLDDAEHHISMGQLTEQGNTDRSMAREAQDAVAVDSHLRAAAAQEAGRLAEEIAPLEVTDRRGTRVIEHDEGIRPDSSLEGLGKLRPAFAKDGTITAGNSSPISDGAAALVLTTRQYAEERGWDWLCVVGADGQVAGPDTQLHEQPAGAIAAALESSGTSLKELDFLEVNEAFAAVAISTSKALGYPLEKTNPNGGAIALGHPVGASGARLVLTAALELQRRGGGRAAVALCGGGGQGEAVLLRR
ncbi:acetyl-CoA C-acetyltransferase [Tessaracoccus sp. OS52]|uniref:acetyl-CoA C-acetyltransferase n=1 Tax=Tessaracoccus sp. OS52 TaxID=2886691 RepID=UPI001D1171BF|nr:acetyl-CoA C-acetyltransferase [Tessaracoccus sp. OS52]MCC2594010.1 acetyl-CoA C-acetyltransferase [Tessaracoccus sp. OS52]